MYDAIVFSVYKLTSDEYSVPRGSFCLVDEELEKMTGFVAVRWLPPHSGGSLPVSLEDLEDAGELSIPLKNIEPVLKEINERKQNV